MRRLRILLYCKIHGSLKPASCYYTILQYWGGGDNLLPQFSIYREDDNASTGMPPRQPRPAVISAKEASDFFTKIVTRPLPNSQHLPPMSVYVRIVSAQQPTCCMR